MWCNVFLLTAVDGWWHFAAASKAPLTQAWRTPCAYAAAAAAVVVVAAAAVVVAAAAVAAALAWAVCRPPMAGAGAAGAVPPCVAQPASVRS